MSDVIAIGETMVVVTPAGQGGLEDSERFRMGIGGAETNVAVHLAAEGVDTAWASRLGSDPLGRRVLTELAGRGVDLAQVTVDPFAPTGLYLKDPDADASGVHYYRAGSAASRLDADDADALPLERFRVVHVSGITPALSESCARFLDRIVDRVSGLSDTALSFDVNHRTRLWSTRSAAVPLRTLAQRADIVFVGLDEAAALWSAATPDDVRRILPDVPTLIVKDGAIGAAEFRGASRTFVPAPLVDVVEPVGAGDAFAAGYLARYLAGVTGDDALRRGHEVAAHVLGSTSDIADGRAPRLPWDRPDEEES